MKSRAWRVALVTSLVCSQSAALAVDAVTGASTNDTIRVGVQGVGLWINGRGFEDGLTVRLSGDGITEDSPPRVVQGPDRGDGVTLLDGIEWTFSVSDDATPGARSLTVVGVDGVEVTRANLVMVADVDGRIPDAGVVPDVGVRDGAVAVPDDAEPGVPTRPPAFDEDAAVEPSAQFSGVSGCASAPGGGPGVVPFLLGLLGVVGLRRRRRVPS